MTNGEFVDDKKIKDILSHGDSSTHIAYIYRGKVCSHRFLWNDEKKYVPTEEVKSIFRKLRKSKL